MIAPARRISWRAARFAGAVVALAIGGYATLTSYAVMAKSARPDVAFALMPRNADIKAAMAEQLLATDPTPARQSRATALARSALRRDPLNVSAVATLGLTAQMRKDVGNSRQLFNYAQRLSRRDYRTQLWAIEDSVGRGSFIDALYHYDIALRTHQNAPDLLFPILGQAIADPGILASVEALLLHRPPWGGSFLGFISEASNPLNVASLINGLLRQGYPVPATATYNLIGSLVKAGEIEKAWSVYGANHPGIVRNSSRYPNFSQPANAASAFDWNPVNDGPVSATIDRVGYGAVLNFAISSGGSGTVVQQLQFLPAGQYILAGEAVDIQQPVDSRPYWTLVCLDGHELGRMPIGGSEGKVSFKGGFSVPAGCVAQWLRLIARPSDALEGVTGTIISAQLRKIE